MKVKYQKKDVYIKYVDVDITYALISYDKEDKNKFKVSIEDLDISKTQMQKIKKKYGYSNKIYM